VIADVGFNGVYIDCNAVSPTTAEQVSNIVTRGDTTFVDGGIIGPPAVKSGSTRLYLSGKSASTVATLFNGSYVDARVLGPDLSAASALKMAYAGWTKGAAALLMTQYAFAQQQHVASALVEEWALSQPGLANKLNNACTGNAPKAWRFVGEMNEIANSLEDAGLPRHWFDSAAETYQRLSEFRNKADVNQHDVIEALLKATDAN